jgi:hypothetical protein
LDHQLYAQSYKPSDLRALVQQYNLTEGKRKEEREQLEFEQRCQRQANAARDIDAVLGDELDDDVLLATDAYDIASSHSARGSGGGAAGAGAGAGGRRNQSKWSEFVQEPSTQYNHDHDDHEDHEDLTSMHTLTRMWPPSTKYTYNIAVLIVSMDQLHVDIAPSRTKSQKRSRRCTAIASKHIEIIVFGIGIHLLKYTCNTSNQWQ